MNENIKEIQEFQISWKNTREQPKPVFADIKLIGKKIFMVKTERVDQHFEFMPLLNDDNEIEGTQIILKDKQKDVMSQIYEIPNNQYKYDKQPYTWANSKMYKGSQNAFLVEA